MTFALSSEALRRCIAIFGSSKLQACNMKLEVLYSSDAENRFPYYKMVHMLTKPLN